MCANNLTYAAATGVATDRERTANEHYHRLMRRATRYAIYGTDQQAADAAEKARRFAHHESSRHNYTPILDQLQRNLEP